MEEWQPVIYTLAFYGGLATALVLGIKHWNWLWSTRLLSLFCSKEERFWRAHREVFRQMSRRQQAVSVHGPGGWLNGDELCLHADGRLWFTGTRHLPRTPDTYNPWKLSPQEQLRAVALLPALYREVEKYYGDFAESCKKQAAYIKQEDVHKAMDAMPVKLK